MGARNRCRYSRGRAVSAGVSVSIPVFKQGITDLLAETSNLRILNIGDSTTIGINAAGNWTDPNEYKWASSIMDEFVPNSAQDAFFGFSTTGGNRITKDPRITNTGGTISSVGCLGGAACRLSTAANNIVFTPESICDTFRVYWFYNGSVAVSIQATGGTAFAQTLTSGSGTQFGTTDIRYADVSAASLTAGNAVTITKTGGAGNFEIVGIEATDSTSKRLQFTNCGHWGSKSADWALTTGAGRQPSDFLAKVPEGYFQLATIKAGINDANSAVSIPTFKANMQVVIDACKAGGMDVILESDNPISAGTTAPYIEALQQLAAANRLYFVNSHDDVFIDYANANAQGWMVDTLHPSPSGYEQMAIPLTDLLISSISVVEQLPPDFAARWTPDFTIYKSGSAYRTDFDFDAIKPTGTTAYITKAGNDTTGDGSSGNPYRTLSKAYTEGFSIFMVGAGIWDRTDGFAANFAPVRSVAVISSDGDGQAILSRGVSGLSWTQQSAPNDSVYVATRSSVRTVIDTTATGRSGEYLKDGVTEVPIPLAVQTSIANCQANLGSWYQSGSNLYVSTWDGRAPDADLLPLLIENIWTPTASVNIWVDGIEAWGDSGARHIPAANNTNFWAWRNSASRFCGSTANLLNVNNIDYCYSINCDCTDHLNTYDGFNYHADQAGLTTRTKFLEVNCIARRVGLNDGGRNDNASTAHDDCVGIRLNGSYGYNWGPTIADVLGSRTLNLGNTSEFSNITTTGDAQRSCFQAGTASAIDGLNTMMWVKDAVMNGGGYALYASAGGTLFDMGGNVDNTAQGNGGTITTYP